MKTILVLLLLTGNVLGMEVQLDSNAIYRQNNCEDKNYVPAVKCIEGSQMEYDGCFWSCTRFNDIGVSKQVPIKDTIKIKFPKYKCEKLMDEDCHIDPPDTVNAGLKICYESSGNLICSPMEGK